MTREVRVRVLISENQSMNQSVDQSETRSINFIYFLHSETDCAASLVCCMTKEYRNRCLCARRHQRKINKVYCFSKKHIPSYGPCWRPELGHPWGNPPKMGEDLSEMWLMWLWISQPGLYWSAWNFTRRFGGICHVENDSWSWLFIARNKLNSPLSFHSRNFSHFCTLFTWFCENGMISNPTDGQRPPETSRPLSYLRCIISFATQMRLSLVK